MKTIKLVLAALTIAGSLSANIGPPTVTDTVTGSAGAWTLDFTIDNTTNQGLYFFGVLGGTITGTPAGWNGNADHDWSNALLGGSSNIYNTNWHVKTSNSTLAPGASLSGFDVLFSGATAPTGVQWFAFTYSQFTAGDPLYTGTGNFSSDSNPGFEGVTPEPSVFVPLSFGVIGLSVLIRRRRVAQS